MAIQLSIDPNIFRTYDIRGIVDETLTVDVVHAIGHALGELNLAKNLDRILIARDGRLSGPKLQEALTQGILSTGCHVTTLGQVPTPVLYFATHTVSCTPGVMITGSHNPPGYTGLKMVIDGETLSSSQIQALYQSIKLNTAADTKNNTNHKPVNNKPVNIGTLTQDNSIESAYLKYICHDITLARPLKIIVDCGHGVAGRLAPELYRRLGCEVIERYCEIDGHFPAHHPDPSCPENLQDLIQTVLKKQADIGLAFDGDGDRLGVVTNQGDIIWPDRQLMLYAQDLLTRHTGATIIYDVKCTQALDAFIRQAGGKPLMWKTGHSLLKAKLKHTEGALLAGEMSGHVFFKERWFGFDDALYTGARLLEILAQRKASASAIFADIPDSINTPELKTTVPENNKIPLMARIINECDFGDEVHLKTIDGLRVEWPYGWGLVRPSNTTPCLTFRSEAQTTEQLEQIQACFREQLLRLDDSLALPF